MQMVSLACFFNLRRAQNKHCFACCLAAKIDVDSHTVDAANEVTVVFDQALRDDSVRQAAKVAAEVAAFQDRRSGVEMLQQFNGVLCERINTIPRSHEEQFPGPYRQS